MESANNQNRLYIKIFKEKKSPGCYEIECYLFHYLSVLPFILKCCLVGVKTAINEREDSKFMVQKGKKNKGQRHYVVESFSLAGDRPKHALRKPQGVPAPQTNDPRWAKCKGSL